MSRAYFLDGSVFCVTTFVLLPHSGIIKQVLGHLISSPSDDASIKMWGEKEKHSTYIILAQYPIRWSLVNIVKSVFENEN